MPRTEPFEKFSDRYDAWFDQNPDKYEAELKALRQLMPRQVAEGLEIGVGSGRFAAPLGIKIGVEPSTKMAIKAQDRGIEVYAGIAENLPFPDAKFDCVLMVTTICFVDDIVKSFAEAYRVLKRGGCITVGFIEKNSELGGIYLESRDINEFYKSATFFSSREVQEYITAAGFDVVEIKQTILAEDPIGAILDGFGKGSFVAIKGIKKFV